MSHKDPEQIYRLIYTIKKLSPNSHILLSHDSTNCSLDVSIFNELSGVDVQFATGDRADFSLVYKYFWAINYLFSNNIDFDWLITLSAQDYPTQPLSELELLLSNTQYDGFLQFFKVFSPESPWSIRDGSQRYLYKYKKLPLSLANPIRTILKVFKLFNYIQPFFKLNFSYGLRFGIKQKSIFNDDFNCYGGYFFSILSIKCVKYLNDFYHNNHQIVEYYKSVLLPEESFIQTVLVNSKKFNLYNECKHYYDFSDTSYGHPAILTEKDYDAMIRKKYYFARKFDLKLDSKILDILDQEFLLKAK
ncbi:MAG: beta-1,6-N-acetylglucosaminyltransferase [Rivularia sp. (in: cyanobacteria)]